MNLSIKECPSYKDETFLLLQQQYEHELSPFTGNKTNNLGLYDAEEIKETQWSKHGVDIYLLVNKHNNALGFAVINLQSMISNRTNIRDVADFYILPKYRKENIGFFFASTLFDRYPNQWEVRQLETLKYATTYWRKVIYKYTQNKFEEFNYYDPVWNENLTFQAFDSKNLNNKA